MLNIHCRNSFFIFKFSPLVFTYVCVEVRLKKYLCSDTSPPANMFDNNRWVAIGKSKKKKEHQNKNNKKKSIKQRLMNINSPHIIIFVYEIHIHTNRRQQIAATMYHRQVFFIIFYYYCICCSYCCTFKTDIHLPLVVIRKRVAKCLLWCMCMCMCVYGCVNVWLCAL